MIGQIRSNPFLDSKFNPAICTPNVSWENDQRVAWKKCVLDQKRGIGSHQQIPCNNAFLQLPSILPAKI